MEKHTQHERSDGKRFWNRIAKLYAPLQERSNHAMYQQLVALCTPYITHDTRVLELGCGTGQLTLPLWQKAAYWEATDYSEPMICELQKRSPAQLTCTVQDATSLPYADQSFNVVLIANALHIMPDPQAALTEIHRVLEPDGVLLAPTFVYERRPSPLRMKAMSILGFPSFHEWTMTELQDLIESSGFQTVEHTLVEADPIPVGFIAATKLNN